MEPADQNFKRPPAADGCLPCYQKEATVRLDPPCDAGETREDLVVRCKTRESHVRKKDGEGGGTIQNRKLSSRKLKVNKVSARPGTAIPPGLGWGTLCHQESLVPSSCYF